MGIRCGFNNINMEKLLMKIVTISDTHRQHRKIDIPGGDVLIHAGDLTGAGNAWEFEDVGKWFEELASRFTWRILIAGNHDFGFEFNAKKILADYFDPGVIYLQDSGITIDGVKFWGSPWTPPFYNWAFMLDESDLAAKFHLIPADTDVLITHGPPQGILDANSNKFKCGSVALYQRVKWMHLLRYHIFGHIHEQGGKFEVIGDTTFVNACVLDHMYLPKHNAFILEIPDENL